MRTLRRFGFLFLLASLTWAADSFPSIEGENLLGKKLAFPEAAKGKPAVIVIGFTHASQTQTKAWGIKLAPEFPVYSIAVLEDVPRLVRGIVSGGIKRGIPQNQRERFLLVYHGEKELKQAVRFQQPDDAYLAVIDRDGAIRWRFHGPVTDSTVQELRAQWTALAAP
jgi:hypothetical protein